MDMPHLFPYIAFIGTAVLFVAAVLGGTPAVSLPPDEIQKAGTPATYPFDEQAAVIFSYSAIGQDETPATSVTLDQFRAHIDELIAGGYTVLPLPDIVAAFRRGEKLPARTIAITFDGADPSVLDSAAPLLWDKDLPFTVFLPPALIEQGRPGAMNWNDIEELAQNKLVSFGLHSSTYGRLPDNPEERRRQINNALAMARAHLDRPLNLFAYPYGLYDQDYAALLRDAGFEAAFGQHSGVAHAGDDLFALPRFALSERYADMDRFRMTASALPLPVQDVSPANPVVSEEIKGVGFTLDPALSDQIKNLSCFGPRTSALRKERIGNRIELRLETLPDGDRMRINCTLPASAGTGQEQRWRWFGRLFSIERSASAVGSPPQTQENFQADEFINQE